MKIGWIFLVIFLITRVLWAVSYDNQENLSQDCQRYFRAIKDRNIDSLPALSRLNNGTCRDREGYSALHILAGIDYSNLPYLLDYVTRVLIHFGGENIGAIDNYHNTPLMLAAGLGNSFLVAKFLTYAEFSEKQYESVINQHNNLGFTALHYAVISRNHKIIKMLLRNGANMHIRDNANRSPIDFAQLLDEDIILMAFTN